jgi:hypothetical protein
VLNKATRFELLGHHQAYMYNVGQEREVENMPCFLGIRDPNFTKQYPCLHRVGLKIIFQVVTNY